MTDKITVFHAQKTNSKAPKSPYSDNTFVFETFDTISNFEMFSIMVSHFILNVPLNNLKKPIRTFRRKANLSQFYSENQSYFILDIDEVTSEFNKQKILDYFKDYRVIIGESRSYNGIDNFNLKGILFSEDISTPDIKIAISSIHHELKEFCVVDECVSRKPSLNAPILKNSILLNNEDGDLYKFIKVDAIELIKNDYIGPVNLQDLTADSIEQLCLRAFQTMGFTSVKSNENGSITFKHDSEVKSPGGYFWFSTSPFMMHHANSVKSMNIFDVVKKLPAAKELMKRNIDYDDELLRFNPDTNVLKVNERFLKITDDVSLIIDSFISKKNGMLSIRSPMGTGKSTIIKKVIDECHENDMKVLIITNRVSVARDFGEKYNMKVYNKDFYEIGDSLICQFDSLWKYNIKFFDIVIMDEFVSLMLHSRSNLNNSSINIAKFFGSFNKKIVIADAFLTGFENFLLSSKKTNLHMIDNVYRDPTTLKTYNDYNYFVSSLLFHCERNKCTVSATSLSFINGLTLLLKSKGLKVVTLTANTPESTKEIIYEKFQDEINDKWDVLIFSPTLSVGVSNLNDVSHHFHFDSSMSTDTITSLQMIKRTRKASEIHLFIKERTNYIKTSYNSIRDEYMGNIGKHIEQNYLFDIDDYGEARLSSIGKKAIKIDTFKNIMEFNHRDAFFWLLKYHFAADAIEIKNKSRNSGILSSYQKEAKANSDLLVRNSIEQFIELSDIEKNTILLDRDADKTLKLLVEIDNDIECSDSKIKAKLFDYIIRDSSFLKKCFYYKVANLYLSEIWDMTDVKNLVNKSVIANDTADLHFFNTLLSISPATIKDDYIPRELSSNKDLKYVLDKCGYAITKMKSPDVIGHRGYSVNKGVKEMWQWMK